MAVTRAKKVAQVEKLGGELKNASSVIVATYSKLTVTQDFELRKALRPTGAKYRVVKNTLAERAGKGTKVEQALKNLEGVTSIAYTEGDPVALAKALAKYVKENPEFSFKGGVVEGKVISVKEIESLATMPSKEEFVFEAAVLVECPGTASRYYDERGRTRLGRRYRPGRGAEEVQRSLGVEWRMQRASVLARSIHKSSGRRKLTEKD